MNGSRAVAALAVSLASSGAMAAPVRVDQMAYAAQLRARRPDLWFARADRCKDQLVLKPVYRSGVLNGRDDYASIVAREYSEDLKAKDKAWADAHRSLARKLKAEQDESMRRLGLDPANKRDPALRETLAKLPFNVRSYPEESFVGYGIGYVAQTSGLQDYLQPKAYLQFRSIVDDLGPEAYVSFTKELSKAGYRGDSKVQLWPGVARFKFNNVVLHPRAKNDIRIAERVASRL